MLRDCRRWPPAGFAPPRASRSSSRLAAVARSAGPSSQETVAAFADELDPQDDARRLRTAIDPATPLLPRMLRDADALLSKARTVVVDAAGLVLCDNRAHARATAALLRTIAGEKPVVVVSDEVGAHARIERFARGGSGAPRWTRRAPVGDARTLIVN